jgi:cytoplasmic iron level regulating protein YaaA (DUF328/UPF0246 family)
VLILLPPSETKRDGGEGDPLDHDALAHPALGRVRRGLVRDVSRLAKKPDVMMERLKLGPKLAFEVERNRTLASAPTMPALERYTGVLYEALEAETLTPEQRAFAGEHVRIHSALFGLLGASDPIPAYRLSHDSRVDAPTVKARWAGVIQKELARHEGELILDLRSEAYVKLGPAPESAFFVRVVSRGPDGVARALNHFNKKGKGVLVRALVQNGVDFPTVEELLAWSAGAGHALSVSPAGELVLEV